jgi:hypothetical protein
MKKLRRYLADDLTILIGGQGASLLGDLIGAHKIAVIKDVVSFRAALDRLRERRHG